MLMLSTALRSTTSGLRRRMAAGTCNALERSTPPTSARGGARAPSASCGAFRNPRGLIVLVGARAVGGASHRRRRAILATKSSPACGSPPRLPATAPSPTSRRSPRNTAARKPSVGSPRANSASFPARGRPAGSEVFHLRRTLELLEAAGPSTVDALAAWDKRRTRAPGLRRLHRPRRAARPRPPRARPLPPRAPRADPHPRGDRTRARAAAAARRSRRAERQARQGGRRREEVEVRRADARRGGRGEGGGGGGGEDRGAEAVDEGVESRAGAPAALRRIVGGGARPGVAGDDHDAHGQAADRAARADLGQLPGRRDAAQAHVARPAVAPVRRDGGRSSPSRSAPA